MVATKVSSYEDITFDVLADAVDEVSNFYYENYAPLGASSKTLVLCGVNGNERKEGVSLRLHSGSVKLLICDWQGHFVFHGGFSSDLDKTMIKSEFFRIFEAVKCYISEPF